MTSKLCKYGCGTLLEGFDEEQRKFLEAGTGGLHTKERCQEAKAKLGKKTIGDKLFAEDIKDHPWAREQEKNDHDNESYSPKVDVQLPPEQTLYPTKTEYVDHTLKGQSKVKIFFARTDKELETGYNQFLEENNGKIKTQGAQFQISQTFGFAIALYYEEVKA